jgi:hypothetical protein
MHWECFTSMHYLKKKNSFNVQQTAADWPKPRSVKFCIADAVTCQENTTGSNKQKQSCDKTSWYVELLVQVRALRTWSCPDISSTAWGQQLVRAGPRYVPCINLLHYTSDMLLCKHKMSFIHPTQTTFLYCVRWTHWTQFFIQVLQKLMSAIKSLALKVEPGFKSLAVNVLRPIACCSDKHKTPCTKHSQSSLNQPLVSFWFKL